MELVHKDEQATDEQATDMAVAESNMARLEYDG